MSGFKKILLLLLLTVSILSCASGIASQRYHDRGWQKILGYWEMLNDRTGKPAGVIKIFMKNGKFYGRLVQSYSEKNPKTALRCTRCKGKRKNQSVLGIILIRDMYYRDGRFIQGYILDPRNGKEYRVKAEVVKNGKYLKVRGYLGFSLFGKTFYWKRIAKPTGKLYD